MPRKEHMNLKLQRIMKERKAFDLIINLNSDCPILIINIDTLYIPKK